MPYKTLKMQYKKLKNYLKQQKRELNDKKRKKTQNRSFKIEFVNITQTLYHNSQNLSFQMS